MRILPRLLLASLMTFASAGMAATTPTQANNDKRLNIEISSDALSAQRNQYYSYSFGSVRIRFSEWADFSLRNNGSGPLYIQGVYLQSGSAYRAWSNCPAYLYPGRTCVTRVEFTPWHEGYETGRLRIAHGNGNIYIDLSGWGNRY